MSDDALNGNSMLYWWPLVEELDIPKPRTVVLREPRPGFLTQLCFSVLDADKVRHDALLRESVWYWDRLADAADELGVTETWLRRLERDGGPLILDAVKLLGELYRRNYVLFWDPRRPPYGPLHWAPFRWWYRAFMRRLARWCRQIAEEWGDE